MRVAFHAPMKPPDHPVPSGDRQLARAFVHALELGGHDVVPTTRLRTFDAKGDAVRQARLARIGERLAARLLRRFRATPRRPDAWFTYHLHHKAPDVIGPHVSRGLAIPYIVAEASVAPKQRAGRWALGYAQSLAALAAADAVVFVNPGDVDEVMRTRPDVRTLMLPPFVDASTFVAPHAIERMPSDVVHLVTVAMMREGAKLASYRLLADALARMTTLPWRLSIVGDGPARAAVESAYASLPAGRVRFLGALGERDLKHLLWQADVFAWPAIDEAFGMALLEAQACGLPVVAGDSPGVASIVVAGATGALTPPGDAQAFAHALRRLIVDERLRIVLGRGARERVRARHDVRRAAAALDHLLQRVRAAHATAG